MTSSTLRERFDRWLVQLQWNWRELTWKQFVIHVSAWVAVIVIILAAWWWWWLRPRSQPDSKTLQMDLRSRDAAVRGHAYEILANRDDAAECFAYALRDQRPEIRAEAAAALASYSHSTAPALQALVDVLLDKQEAESTRAKCVDALQKAKGETDVAVTALRHVLLDQDEGEWMRGKCAESLRNTRGRADDTIQAFRQVAENMFEPPGLRILCGILLKEMGYKPKDDGATQSQSSASQ